MLSESAGRLPWPQENQQESDEVPGEPNAVTS